MIGEKKSKQEQLRFLKVYSNALFKYTEEKKNTTTDEDLVLLKNKLKNNRNFIKINIYLILIVIFIIILCALSEIGKIRDMNHFIEMDILNSKTYSESFYKSLSDELQKVKQSFSYTPKQKDYITFENIHSKFDFASWIYNTLAEKISHGKVLNNNILFGNCWRITTRLYKKQETDDNIYNFKKEYSIYSDSSFNENIENNTDVEGTLFGTRYVYPFSFERSYYKLGGIYQTICSSNLEEIKTQLNHNTKHTEHYPYFLPALFLTKYHVASVTIDFLTFNPMMKILSYHILKVSFLPNLKTYKNVVTLSAIYNSFSWYFFTSVSILVFMLLLYIWRTIIKIHMLGIREYFQSYVVQFVFIVSVLLTSISFIIYSVSQYFLPDLKARYINGVYSIGNSFNTMKAEEAEALFDKMHYIISIIRIKKQVFVYCVAFAFILFCIMFMRQFKFLVKKYHNVERNMKQDFLFPCFFILLFIIACAFALSVYAYKLFEISEHVNSSILRVFIFNLCLIFANVQGFNISSLVNSENTVSYFFTLPILFITVTISFALVLFIAVKSFIKRSRKKFALFSIQTGNVLSQGRDTENMEKEDSSNELKKQRDNGTFKEHLQEFYPYINWDNEYSDSSSSSDYFDMWSENEEGIIGVSEKNCSPISKSSPRNYLKLEKYLSFVFNAKKSVLPLEDLQKKRLLKQYTDNKNRFYKKRIFFAYLTILVLVILLIFLSSDHKTIFETEKIIYYQIENIYHIDENNTHHSLQYNYLNQDISIQIKKDPLHFKNIVSRKDVFQWMRTAMVYYLQNKIKKGNNDSRPEQKDIKDNVLYWKHLFEFSYQKGINIVVNSREPMYKEKGNFVCSSKLTSCSVIFENDNTVIKKIIEELEFIINESVESITITFILFDKQNNHNILVTINFYFSLSGYISKNIYLNHCFFDYFNIYSIRGIWNHILCFVIACSWLFILFLWFFRHFRMFHGICMFYLNQEKNPMFPSTQGYQENIPMGNFGSPIHQMNYVNGNYPVPPTSLRNSNNYSTNKRIYTYRFRTFILFLFESNNLILLLLPLHIALFTLWILLTVKINTILQSTDMDSHFNTHLHIFPLMTHFMNISYMSAFFTIIKQFTYLSSYFRKETIYESLISNKRQITKFFTLMTFIYLSFALFDFFFYKLDKITNFTWHDYLISSSIQLLGRVPVETYLKSNKMYFLFFILPYLICIRVLFIYSFLAPILSTYLILVKRKSLLTSHFARFPPSKKIIQTQSEKERRSFERTRSSSSNWDYNTFTLTRLSNEQWELLNEDIKEFAVSETHRLLEFFRILKKESEYKKSSELLKDVYDSLHERLLDSHSNLRKIDLQWKFLSKLLNSESAKDEKINYQINEMEETISKIREQIIYLKQRQRQLSKKYIQL